MSGTKSISGRNARPAIRFSGWTLFNPPSILTSSLEPTGERSGRHLSQILDYMGKTMGEKYGDEDPTSRFVCGFVWETAVEFMRAGMTLDEAMDAAFRRYMLALRKDVVTQVQGEKDGIRMTPDAFVHFHGELESYKYTHRRLPATQAEFEEKFWKWCYQESSYCTLMGVDTVRWIVMWARGNYKDIQGPVVMQATATWTPEELAANWSVVLAHNSALDKKRREADISK